MGTMLVTDSNSSDDGSIAICRHMLQLKGFTEILRYIGTEPGVSLEQILKFTASKKLIKDKQHVKIIVHALKNMKLVDSTNDEDFHLTVLGEMIFDDGLPGELGKS